MNDKKRLMFILEEDYYYVTLKIIAALTALKCNKKALIDYRKLCIIYEFMKKPDAIELIDKRKLNINEVNTLINIAYSSKMNSSSFKQLIFFLEKKEIIYLKKNEKLKCIDIYLRQNKETKFLIDNNILEEDIINVKQLQKKISRIRSVKLSTLNEKIFGKSDRLLWEN